MRRSSAGRLKKPRACCGFTLAEMLVVVGIMALLLSILMPSLSRARQSAQRTACLSNVRSLAIGQALYATSQRDLLVVAGDGSYGVQGSWIGLLDRYAGHALVRRCPGDRSRYFDEPYTAFSPPVNRLVSYGINNYVSPTHAPPRMDGRGPLQRISQIRRPAGVVQFVELAETGAYAVADHLHAQEFYKPLTPQLTPSRAATQMALGRHGGKGRDWSGALNYSFLDGHAEGQALRAVYTGPSRNRFNPDVSP